MGGLWADGYAHNLDRSGSRMLFDGRAMLAAGGAEEQKKKTALTSGKVISAKPNILRLYYKTGMERNQ